MNPRCLNDILFGRLDTSRLFGSSVTLFSSSIRASRGNDDEAQCRPSTDWVAAEKKAGDDVCGVANLDCWCYGIRAPT